ncbi:MAG UNVERIFIED_CONTAM: hypothetical protein LVT10_23850 [Anaerolineae bacterium]
MLQNAPLEALTQTALQTVENLRRNVLEDDELKFSEFIAPVPSRHYGERHRRIYPWGRHKSPPYPPSLAS